MAEFKDISSTVTAGNDLYLQGQYREAIEQFEKAGDNPEALKGKANALLALSMNDEAIACYDRLVELTPKDASALLEKAQFLIGLARYPEAVETCEQALVLSPDQARIHRLKGLSLRLSGESEDALAAYGRSLELDDLDSDTWAGKADLLIELGRTKEAIDCLERASDTPDNRFGSVDWRTRGTSIALAGDHNSAILCYEKAIKGDPRDALAFLGKARSLLAMDPVDFDGAFACLDRAIEIEPDNYRFYSEKANALYTNGRTEEALDLYNIALRFNPTDKYSWINQGFCLESMNKLEPALNAYSKAIECDPKFAKAWEAKGGCLGLLGKPFESAKALRRALAINPDLFWARNDLGWLLLKHLDNPEAAITQLNKAIKLNPEQALPYANKAQALVKLERPEDAREVLEDALDRVSDRGLIMRSLGHIYFDSFFQPEKALELYEKAEQAGPVDPILYLCMGEVFVCLGQQEKARQRIREWEGKTSDTGGDPRLFCVASFLRFASYVIDKGLDEASEYFQIFLDRMQDCENQENRGPTIPSTTWRYDGFCVTIKEKSMESLKLITLLICVDFQTGQLAARSLEGLDEKLRLPKLASIQDKRKPSVFSTIADIALSWMRKKGEK